MVSTSRNPFLIKGVELLGRRASKEYNRKRRAPGFRARQWKKVTPQKKVAQPKVKPFGKKGETRTIKKKGRKSYPEEDQPHKLRNHKVHRPTRLRKSITPGTVLILLAGRFRGRKVVFLRKLNSGLLLITGPFRINGIPLRRVNQRYVIATSTKLNIKNVKIDVKINDYYFNKHKDFRTKKAKKAFLEKLLPKKKVKKLSAKKAQAKKEAKKKAKAAKKAAKEAPKEAPKETKEAKKETKKEGGEKKELGKKIKKKKTGKPKKLSAKKLAKKKARKVARAAARASGATPEEQKAAVKEAVKKAVPKPKKVKKVKKAKAPKAKKETPKAKKEAPKAKKEAPKEAPKEAKEAPKEAPKGDKKASADKKKRVRKLKASIARIKDQKKVDKQILKIIKKEPYLAAYLRARFSLSAGQYPHNLKF